MAVFAAVAPFRGGRRWRWRRATGRGAWLNLLYLSLFCTLFAFFVQMWAVRRTSPSRVSLLLGTEPLWAAVVGIALGGDRPGMAALAGAVLVLAGTEWGGVRRLRRRPGLRRSPRRRRWSRWPGSGPEPDRA